MAVTKTTFGPGLSSTSDTNAWRTEKLWTGLKIDEQLHAPQNGPLGFFEDFVQVQADAATTAAVGKFVAGNTVFATYVDTGGTIAGEAGASTIAMDLDTSNDDANTIAWGNKSSPFKLDDTYGKFVMGARFKVDQITDNAQAIFFGLQSTQTLATASTILADGASTADESVVGFFIDEADGDQIQLLYGTEGTAATVADASAHTLVAGTYVKCEATYSPLDDYFRWYINGVQIASVLSSATNFPDSVALGLYFGMKNGDTTAAGLSLDWIGAYQARPNALYA